ncbi:MAG: hypothetical protein GY835_01630, partial [bacterium]|nr:hypothetical protein [bacterium]
DWPGDHTWQCFHPVDGSVVVAHTTSAPSASEWLTNGTLPLGIPVDMEVMVQDEEGETLEFEKFYNAYLTDPDDPPNPGEPTPFDGLTPDGSGFYSVTIPLKTTYSRACGGIPEPSKPDGVLPDPELLRRTDNPCVDEFPQDRYQRVSIDNLDTGQSWSTDIENPWAQTLCSGGGGQGQVELKARRGDRLRVRYNISALGYIALIGSGITVVDLNRFYKSPTPQGSEISGWAQCGRRQGAYEGEDIDFNPEPDPCPGVLRPDSMAMTTAVALQGGDSSLEAGSTIHTYSPLRRFGAVHALSPADRAGRIRAAQTDPFICVSSVERDVALASNATWMERGIRGQLNGSFYREPDVSDTGKEKTGDLAFFSLGEQGIYAFDVSSQTMGESDLIGHLRVGQEQDSQKHYIYRLQVDEARNLLFAGGFDETDRPIIDIWDIANVNGAPDIDCGDDDDCPERVFAPRPIQTLYRSWNTNHIAIDQSGTGLLYTWDSEEGLGAAPFAQPSFTFHGLYLPETADADDQSVTPVSRITHRFVPLGVPMETSIEAEADKRASNDARATAAFKLRVALPGSMGEELSVRVQSLRVLPDPSRLANKDVGPAVGMPGGLGWPDNDVLVTMRRLGSEAAGEEYSEGGVFAPVYNLYESVQTVVLLADPHASRDYTPQSVPGSIFTEAAQCRRCTWPAYLADAPEVVELLASGRYIRAFLDTDCGEDGGPMCSVPEVATLAVIDFFDGQGDNYRAPTGYAENVGRA